MEINCQRTDTQMERQREVHSLSGIGHINSPIQCKSIMPFSQDEGCFYMHMLSYPTPRSEKEDIVKTVLFKY